jgi:polyisoprenoid-binding protein YceI
MKRLVLATLAIFALPLLAGSSTWTIDPNHTRPSFAVSHLLISTVRGDFSRTKGTIQLDEDDITKSSVEVTIDATSIDTRVEARNKHLNSADFFDTAKFPTITFKSTQVAHAGPGRLKVTGDLTMKGVTKSVVLDVVGPTKPITDPWGGTRRGLSATVKVSRKAFGISFDPAGIGDEVAITIDTEFTKVQPAAPQPKP